MMWLPPFPAVPLWPCVGMTNDMTSVPDSGAEVFCASTPPRLVSRGIMHVIGWGGEKVTFICKIGKGDDIVFP